MDVKNCSECGVLVQVPFPLGKGTIVNLALPDDDTGTWATRPALVIWTLRNAANNFCTGIEHLGGDRAATPEMEWETDPRKPSPADLSFLMQASFFQAILRTELCFQLNALQKTLVSAGERLIFRGEPWECLYLIQKGT